MYNQLIYFIVVLLLFSVQHQTGKPAAHPTSDAFFMAALFVSFILYCRGSFSKIHRVVIRGMPSSAHIRAFYRVQAQLSILAIGYLALYLYAFNLRLYLVAIPGYRNFTTVSGIVGLAIYMLHLAVVWYFSYPTYQAIHGSQVGRPGFLKGHLSFTSVILVPWFLVSTITDLLQLVQMPAFMQSDIGQFGLIMVALLGFVLFGPWLIVRMWGCEPLPEDPVKAELQAFCDEHDFKTGGLMLWPIFSGEMLTAGVVGILPKMRYLLITSGLLRVLDPPELKAVVAHEMGHVRKKHLILFVFLFVLFIWFAYGLSNMIYLLALSNGTVLRWVMKPGDLSASVLSLLEILPVLALMVVYIRFIFGFFLRNSERQADLFAMELIGDPRPLISSFEKIAFRSGRIEDLPSWHHYSIRERIHFLVDAFRDRTLIRKHNRKLYGSVAAFVVIVSALIFVNAKTDHNAFFQNMRDRIDLARVEQVIIGDPENMTYQALYGGLLYEKGRYSEAESVLRSVITRDPENSSALNNLAWLYATGPPPFRNPREALALALRAVSESPEPVYLDTLAEAYFVNGRYADALDAIEEALSRGADPQQDHYLKQKEKFEKALRGEIVES